MTFSVAFTLCQRRSRLPLRLHAKNFHKLAPTREKQSRKRVNERVAAATAFGGEGQKNPSSLQTFESSTMCTKSLTYKTKCQMTRFLEYWILLSILRKWYTLLPRSLTHTHTHTEQATLVVVHTTPRATERQREVRETKGRRTTLKSISLYEKSFQLPFMRRRRRQDGSGKTIACYDRCQSDISRAKNSE